MKTQSESGFNSPSESGLGIHAILLNYVERKYFSVSTVRDLHSLLVFTKYIPLNRFFLKDINVWNDLNYKLIYIMLRETVSKQLQLY